jgi:hypothetical protein
MKYYVVILSTGIGAKPITIVDKIRCLIVELKEDGKDEDEFLFKVLAYFNK